MSDIKIIHERRTRILISRRGLEQMLSQHALNIAGFIPSATRVNITFEEELEGSPSYKVGTKCVIDLVEDQHLLPQEEP